MNQCHHNRNLVVLEETCADDIGSPLENSLAPHRKNSLRDGLRFTVCFTQNSPGMVEVFVKAPKTKGMRMGSTEPEQNKSTKESLKQLARQTVPLIGCTSAQIFTPEGKAIRDCHKRSRRPACARRFESRGLRKGNLKLVIHHSPNGGLSEGAILGNP